MMMMMMMMVVATTTRASTKVAKNQSPLARLKASQQDRKEGYLLPRQNGSKVPKEGKRTGKGSSF